MRVPLLTCCLLVALLCGLALALPVEDLPETPYDESETLPYDNTPWLVIEAAEESEGMGPELEDLHRRLQLASSGRGEENNAQLKELPAEAFFESITIFEHSLRC